MKSVFIPTSTALYVSSCFIICLLFRNEVYQFILSGRPHHMNLLLHVSVGLVQLEQRAHNVWLALDDARRPRGGRRQSSIMTDRQIQQLGEDRLNPPGPIDNAIFRFLRHASHQMENLVHEILRRGAREQ